MPLGRTTLQIMDLTGWKMKDQIPSEAKGRDTGIHHRAV